MFYFHKVAYVQYLGEVGIFHTWVKKFLPLTTVQKLQQSIEIFQSYEGRSINKLQNGIILLIFKI